MWNEELKTVLDFAADGISTRNDIYPMNVPSALTGVNAGLIYPDSIKRGDDTTSNFSHP